jgi:Protein of unknown function (DUF3300)
MRRGWTSFRVLSLVISTALLVSTTPALDGFAQSAAETQPSSRASAATSLSSTASSGSNRVADVPGPAPGAASPEQLQELASPIALYPDLLVARILAASTYPDQVVEAHRWLQQNPKLPPDELAAKVNAQPWDPSIKSLTQFPQVLQTMNDSLAWTSALGEAYYNQPDDVMDAIQVLRVRATDAGTLKSTPQQKVEVQPAPAPAAAEDGAQPAVQQQTVVIQPAEPNVVYVPQYNPTTAYGAPVAAPQGYTGTEMLTTGLLSFGLGMTMGALINDGDDDWDCDWHGDSGHGGSVTYNNNVEVSNSRVTSARGNYAANRPARAGGRARATPYRGANSPGARRAPSTRPYDSARARQYAGNNPNIQKPTFSKGSEVPRNSRPGNSSRNLAQSQPNRASTRAAQPASRMSNNRSATQNRAGNAATQNRAGNQTRGFGGGASAKGGRNGAFGDYQPGGLAQASSNRGRSSFGGGGGGFGGGGFGGGGKRGGGGGRGGGGRGGGGRRR